MIRNAFFAMVDRGRYIQRWSLMRNTQPENIAEHSFMTAVIAHSLAVFRMLRFSELPAVAPEKVMAFALYHDVTEVITGDLPTPVKYHDAELQTAYKSIEALAAEDLLHGLPEDVRAYYAPFIKEGGGEAGGQEQEIRKLVKAADKISAYLKCVSELSQGNGEFKQAAESTLAKIKAMDMPEADLFISEFADAFALSLDQLRHEE